MPVPPFNFGAFFGPDLPAEALPSPLALGWMEPDDLAANIFLGFFFFRDFLLGDPSSSSVEAASFLLAPGPLLSTPLGLPCFDLEETLLPFPSSSLSLQLLS